MDQPCHAEVNFSHHWGTFHNVFHNNDVSSFRSDAALYVCVFWGVLSLIITLCQSFVVGQIKAPFTLSLTGAEGEKWEVEVETGTEALMNREVRKRAQRKRSEALGLRERGGGGMDGYER